MFQHEIRSVTKVLEASDDVLAEAALECAFNVRTLPDGYNCGRDYCFKTESRSAAEEWIALLSRVAKTALRRETTRSRIQHYRASAPIRRPFHRPQATPTRNIPILAAQRRGWSSILCASAAATASTISIPSTSPKFSLRCANPIPLSHFLPRPDQGKSRGMIGGSWLEAGLQKQRLENLHSQPAATRA